MVHLPRVTKEREDDRFIMRTNDNRKNTYMLGEWPVSSCTTEFYETVLLLVAERSYRTIPLAQSPANTNSALFSVAAGCVAGPRHVLLPSELRD